MRDFYKLSILLVSFGAGFAGCSGDAGSSDAGDGDAAQNDAPTTFEAGDAVRPGVDSSRDTRGDGAADDGSLDAIVDEDGERDAVNDPRIDGPTDTPTDPAAPDASDVGPSDVHGDGPHLADALDAIDGLGPTAPDAGPVTDASDAMTDDGPVSDRHVGDAPIPDANTIDAPAVDAPDPVDADASTPDASTPDAPGDAPRLVDVVDDAADNPADGGPPNIIFATSLSYPSNLGGLAGADEKCRQRAQAAGLSGTFVALLSTTTVSAKSRLGTARGWVRTDGKPVADRQQDLFSTALTAIDSARIYYPPNRDEFGNALPVNTMVNSGTQFDGTLDPRGTNSCEDWTSTAAAMKAFGYPSNGAHGYISSGWSSCPYAANLMCIEISRTSRVDPPTPPPNRRRAFVSNGYFYPRNGISGADTVCRSDASAAGLPGTYRALLATTTASGMSRFDLGGAPWVRIDGVVLGETAADFAAGRWLAPLNVTPRGAHIANWGVWVGAPGPSALGASTCGDWNPADPSIQGATTSIAYSGDAAWWIEQRCDWLSGRVYCLQE
jgi:hypothetical protein